ncbi:Abscisic acid receptor PYL4 [Linum grandiflorum]
MAPSFLHLHRTSRHVHPLHQARDHDNDDTRQIDIQLEEVPDYVACHHTRTLRPNQCCSAVVQCIDAPVSKVWSVVRRFDRPHAYKHFLKSCRLIRGHGGVGSLREVHVVSGLPARSSTERLEILDEERHVISFSVVGGDHRLSNYRSVTTLHSAADDTIVRCNLQSLAHLAENMAGEK